MRFPSICCEDNGKNIDKINYTSRVGNRKIFFGINYLINVYYNI